MCPPEDAAGQFFYITQCSVDNEGSGAATSFDLLEDGVQGISHSGDVSSIEGRAGARLI